MSARRLSRFRKGTRDMEWFSHIIPGENQPQRHKGHKETQELNALGFFVSFVSLWLKEFTRLSRAAPVPRHARSYLRGTPSCPSRSPPSSAVSGSSRLCRIPTTCTPDGPTTCSSDDCCASLRPS